MTRTMIFGYGSLLETGSRTRTNPEAEYAFPAMVEGISRGWFHRFSEARPGTTTTFLGAIESSDATCNGVIYEVADIGATDARERGYHRVQIDSNEIRMLDGLGVPDGEIYVYVSNDECIRKADPDTPIVQSYVDICVRGSFEVEGKYRIAAENQFARKFFELTTDWSEYWVNDRSTPRRASSTPKSGLVDAACRKYVNEYFSKVTIE